MPTQAPEVAALPPALQAENLALKAGGRIVQQGLNFSVHHGEVLAIAGPSGCGKSTLMRHLIGLETPLAGRVLRNGRDVHQGSDAEQQALRRSVGVMFQAGALWSSMPLGENLMWPMRLFMPWDAAERERRARFLLALVGLPDAFALMPASLSGGMRKRAALARALALEPSLLFLDEPGSGLDPANAARIDDLVLHLRDDLGTTVVLVTHDIGSILAVADRMLYLDDQAHTMTALGHPEELRRQGPPAVREFLSRSHAADSPIAGAGQPGARAAR